MSDPTSGCPDCGSPLPADSTQKLCPACLMRQVLASRTLLPDGERRPLPPPPSPEEIASRFPQFEILECLGQGGMGVVYKARQKSLNRLVAIKILSPERGGEARFAERFAREAEMLAKLSHPHIVTIHDFGQSDGLFHLVMEYVDGVNLRDLLRDGKLEPEQALAIVPPVCEALQYAHDKGIVHRDIKPENLLLDREGRIKIADFGIAALMGTEGEEAGTPPYMAPEQSKRSGGIDHRADLYALGVVLYEMLTGERPARELVAPSRKVQIDVRLDEMVLRALEKTPELRYQTAAEFRTVVETMADEVGKEESPEKRRKRRRKKVVFRFPDPLPSKRALLGWATGFSLLGVLLFVFAEAGWEIIRDRISVLSPPHSAQGIRPGGPDEKGDPIERLTHQLNATGGMWINGLSPSLDLPPTATGDEVLLRIIAVNRLGPNVRTLELRRDWPIGVAAAGADRFTAALVETDKGERIILFRWEGNDWWSRVFELP